MVIVERLTLASRAMDQSDDQYGIKLWRALDSFPFQYQERFIFIEICFMKEGNRFESRYSSWDSNGISWLLFLLFYSALPQSSFSFSFSG
jgi:hypothetical protein